MAKGLSAAKAKKILQDGYVKGKPLTAKQKKYFGAIASGGTPGFPPWVAPWGSLRFSGFFRQEVIVQKVL